MDVMRRFSLEGRRALVTGGSKGLGLVMATAFAEAGADVVLVARSRDLLEESAGAIASATGRKAIAIAADVSHGEEVRRMAADAEQRLGPIDILVNNAGNNARGLVQELTEDMWDSVIDTNLKSVFLCAREFGPRMAQRGWGRVINMGSILSFIAMPGRAPYASAKAGITGITRVLALEWAPSGVTVNAICPGPFGTDINKPIMDDPERYAAFIAKIPMGRWGDLQEIAGPALFLASDAASYITGSCLTVDGGWTAQ